MLRLVGYGLTLVTAGLALLAATMVILPIRDTSQFTSRMQPGVALAVLGDYGSGDYRQRRVAHLLESECRRLGGDIVVQTVGDNFYPDGVTSADDPLWQSHFLEMYDTPCNRRLQFHAALGNHDYGGDPDAQVRTSDRWRMPRRAWHYRIDDGTTVAVAVLDTMAPIDDQIPVLEAAFTEPADWRIVAGHHNVRTASVKYAADERLERTLLPHLKRLGVDLYLAGHSHNLQLITAPGEPVYVISGAGGKGPRKLRPMDNSSVFAAERSGFVTLEFSPEAATMTFVATGGEFLTTFTTSRHAFRLERTCGKDGCTRKVMPLP